MAFSLVRQLLDRLSVKAIFNRLDKRKLQNELDTHRLFLVTSHHERILSGKTIGETYVSDLAAEAERLGHEGMRSVVAASLQQQFASTSTMLHNILSQASDPMPAAKHAISADTQQKRHADAPSRQRPRGLAAAMGVADFRSSLPSTTSTSTAASPSQSPSSSASSRSSNASSEVVTSFYNDRSHLKEVSSSASDVSSNGMDSTTSDSQNSSTSHGNSGVDSSSSLPSSSSSFDNSAELSDNSSLPSSSSSSRLAGSSTDSDSNSNIPSGSSSLTSGSSINDNSNDLSSSSSGRLAGSSTVSDNNSNSSSSLPNSSSISDSDSSSLMGSSTSSDNNDGSARHKVRTIRNGLSMAELSAALQKQDGFSLDVRRSSISHPDAGDGLWLQGRAAVGALVALYPGLVYEPMHYRKISGYPRIDAKNDYFLARFDGALIDGQSWGRGRTTLSRSPPIDTDPHSSYHAMIAQLHQKEMRHPLALAHFANHPPAGTQPNVMVAAFDFASGREPWLPAYMPNIMYQDLKAANSQDVEQSKLIKGLALVAIQPIHDEEIYLNYRLNPQVQKPAWYAAVDAEEDKRRWY